MTEKFNNKNLWIQSNQFNALLAEVNENIQSASIYVIFHCKKKLLNEPTRNFILNQKTIYILYLMDTIITFFIKF